MTIDVSKAVLSNVAVPTIRETPSAAGLIAETAAGLIGAGLTAKDKFAERGLESDLTDAQSVLSSASEELQNTLNDPNAGIDPGDASALDDMGARMTRHASAVQQGISNRDAAALNMTNIFKTFIAENPHLRTEANQIAASVQQTTGVSASLGIGAGSASTSRMTPEEKNYRDREIAVTNLQSSLGLQDRGAAYTLLAQQEQAEVRANLAPLHAGQLSDWAFANSDAMIGETTVSLLQGLDSVDSMSPEQLNEFTSDAKSAIVAQQQSLVSAIRTQVASLRANGQSIPEAGVQTIIDNTVNRLKPVYDMLNDGNLTGAKGILQANAEYAAAHSVEQWNTAVATISETYGEGPKGFRLNSLLVESKPQLDTQLRFFSAASSFIDAHNLQQKDGTILDASLEALMGSAFLKADEVAGVQNALDILQTMGTTDIVEFLFANQTKEADVNMGGVIDGNPLETVQDITNSAYYSLLAKEANGAPTLTLPSVINIMARPQPDTMLTAVYLRNLRAAVQIDGVREQVENSAKGYLSAATAFVGSKSLEFGRWGLTVTRNSAIFNEDGTVNRQPYQPSSTDRAGEVIEYIKVGSVPVAGRTTLLGQQESLEQERASAEALMIARRMNTILTFWSYADRNVFNELITLTEFN